MQLNDSERLKQVRKQNYGISQAKLAEIIGVPNHRIKDIESGKVKISIDIAQMIEEKFNFDFKWLLTGQGSQKKVDNQKLEIAEKQERYEPLKNTETLNKLIKTVENLNLRMAELEKMIVEKDCRAKLTGKG
jgi:DNA-binding XRE family transcriptional regulator